MRLKALFSCCFYWVSLLAMASIPVGTWRTHLSYSVTDQLVLTPKKVMAVADHHLFSIDKEDRLLETYTKQDGLSENNVQKIAYHPQMNVLVIVYTNANIDIYTADGVIYNIPDVMQKNWTVDKRTYQIYCEGDKVYLAMGFGVVALNLKKMEVEDTYIIGPNATKIPVYGFTASDSLFFALTEKAILKAPKQGKNLLDYANWQHEPITLPPSSQCKTLHYFDSTFLTVDREQRILKYDTQWKEFYTGTPGKVEVASMGTQVLLSRGAEGVERYNTDLEHLQHYPFLSVSTLYDETENILWLSQEELGVIRYQEKPEEIITAHLIQSVGSSTIQELVYAQHQLWVTPGGAWIDRLGNPVVLSCFQEESWKALGQRQLKLLDFIDWTLDATSLSVDPTDPSHYFFSTWGEGIFEVKNDQVVNRYAEENTQGVLASAIPGNPHFVRVDGMRFDNNGNLWSLNSRSGVKIRHADGHWSALNYPPLTGCPIMRQLRIMKTQKWFVSMRDNPGVFVFDDAGTLEDPSDDRYRFFRSGSFYDKDGKVIAPTHFYSLAIGKDGTVWVGTDWGPILFTQPKNVFESDYRCTRVKIPREDGSGLADYLLDGETVLAIKVDAANRKWVGTASSGAYLFSPDGKQTLQHFTTENSALGSNSVNAIEIIAETGEVFFATEEGLFSYRADATQPVSEATSQTIKVFPNPVRPEYNGMITVDGLEENSHVWITDAAGGVVFQGRSNGGSCVWDGRNYAGKYVSGGVYFVLVSNADSEHHRSVASKLLIVR